MMKRALAFGSGAALLILLWALAAGVGPDHVSTGVLVGIGPAGLTLLDHGRRITLVVGNPTVVSDEAGHTLGLADLRPGDSLREECVPLGLGQFLARRITVLGRTGNAPERSAAGSHADRS